MPAKLATVTAAADVLPVGDDRRRALGRPAVWSLMFATSFLVVILLTKEVAGLYAAEPWREDPYDALVSFAFGAIPLIVGAGFVRLRLCRRYEPLPVRRLTEVFDLSRSALAVVIAVVVSEWISIAVSPSSLRWTPTTVVLVALLGVYTVVAALLAVLFRRAGRHFLAPESTQPDLLTDLVAVLNHEAKRLGPFAEPTRRVVVKADFVLSPRARRHPLLAGGVLAAGAGAVFAAPKVFIEHYRPSLVAFVFAVSACSFFALVVIVGTRLGVVARPHDRSSVAAITITAVAAAVPLSMSFRNSLWWVIGTTEQAARLREFVLLGAASSLATLIVTPVFVGWSRRGSRA